VKSRFVFAAGSILAAAQLIAAESEQNDLEQQVIVTGTRRAERTAADSSVPIDVISNSDLQSTASTDLNNKLQAIVPSYSVRRLPLSDGAIFVRPATLRGLSPDQTLVLVNGKRLHRSAFVDVTFQGSQAPDLSNIPQIALKRVEVLRDGASAQYGSDAIAGVVNLILDDTPGIRGYTQFGQYSEENDGESIQAALTAGFALSDAGFLRLSAEYANSDATSRSIQRPQAEALIALGEPYASTIRQPVVQRFGQPDLEAYRFFYNGKYTLTGSSELYAFGNYGHLTGVNDFNWRAPAAAGGAGASSAYSRSAFQNGPNAVFPDWSLASVFPGGFTPLFGTTENDYSTALGARGEITSNLTWDLSGSFGRSKIDYQLDDTINASLGPLSPTSFDAGSRQQTDTSANLDFVYRWQTVLADPVNIGFGAEHRREEFEIAAGEPASYEVGPLADLASGSNGFPGASPLQAGRWSRTNSAFYIDLDADITERWNVAAAGRFEDYSTFGSTTNGKLSTRYSLTDWLNVRAAVSTGFRAPTPGQANLVNTNQFPDAATGTVRTRGLLPPTSEAARLFGGTELTPETSNNYSAGFVLQPLPSLTFTLDFYRIDVDDRIGTTQSFTLTDAQRNQLVSLGVPGAAQFFQVSFFTNGYSTRTEGIDAVLTYRKPIGPGTLGIISAYNHNETEVTSSKPGVLDTLTTQRIEDQLPNTSATLSFDYQLSKWSLLARARHYGSWLAVSTTGTQFNQLQGALTFVDVAGTYALTDNVKLTAGAENLFNEYTDRERYLFTVGRKYITGSPYENDGRQVYLRANIAF
jgi:iron complex outermembrane receptor protein